MKFKLLACAICLAVGTSLIADAEAGKKPKEKTEWEIQMEEIAQETWEESDLFIVERMQAEDAAKDEGKIRAQKAEAEIAAKNAELNKKTLGELLYVPTQEEKKNMAAAAIKPQEEAPSLSRAERKAKAEAAKERKQQMARLRAAQVRFVLHQAQNKVVALQKEDNLLMRQLATQDAVLQKSSAAQKENLAQEIIAAQEMENGIVQSLQQGDYWAGIASFNKAALLAPNAAWLYDLRGQCYVLLKQRHLAEADYSRAIGLSPKTPEYYVNRSNLYHEMNKPDLADADLRYADQLIANSQHQDRI